jgi:hypothetical protein
MDFTILIAIAIGATLPCIILWVADERDRLRRSSS